MFLTAAVAVLPRSRRDTASHVVFFGPPAGRNAADSQVSCAETAREKPRRSGERNNYARREIPPDKAEIPARREFAARESLESIGICDLNRLN